MDRTLAKEWIEGLEHDSKEFRAFIDFCYIHFHNHMDVMAEAFVTADGEEAFNTYLESMSGAENQALCKADEQRDAELDR